jgi:hypothetical protein
VREVTRARGWSLHRETRNLGLNRTPSFPLPQSNPKADIALMQNFLWTPSLDSMCGVTLEVGETYVLSGRIISEKAFISLCGLSIRWADTTSRQRTGLRKLYEKGCVCDVSGSYRPSRFMNRFPRVPISWYWGETVPHIGIVSRLETDTRCFVGKEGKKFVLYPRGKLWFLKYRFRFATCFYITDAFFLNIIEHLEVIGQ